MGIRDGVKNLDREPWKAREEENYKDTEAEK